MHVEIKVPKKRSAWAHFDPLKRHVEIYAKIRSETDPSKEYDVAKFVSLWGTIYKCSCQDHFWRFAQCKHIAQLKYAEARQYKTKK